jgi:hypothetical protein
MGTELPTIWPSTASRTCSSSWSDMAVVNGVAAIICRELQSCSAAVTREMSRGSAGCWTLLANGRCGVSEDVACNWRAVPVSKSIQPQRWERPGANQARTPQVAVGLSALRAMSPWVRPRKQTGFTQSQSHCPSDAVWMRHFSACRSDFGGGSVEMRPNHRRLKRCSREKLWRPT